MTRENISEETLNNISYKLIDKVGDYHKLNAAGYTKQAEETRQYIHGMMAVINALGYDIEYAENGEAIILSMDF